MITSSTSSSSSFLSKVAMCAVFLAGSVTAAVAADKPADKKPAEKVADKVADKAAPKADAKADPKKAGGKVDVNGTWTWSSPGRDGTVRESTLVLKADGEKLTGTLTGRGPEAPIADGKLAKDGTVTFKVERERNGEKMVAKYTGKLEAGLIKGTFSSNFGGQEQERPWEAKKSN